MKLSEWARQQGVSYQTAWRWVKSGRMPVPVHQTPSGTWIVDEPAQAEGRTVAYCRHVVQAYRFTLDPGIEGEARLRSRCGAARVAYNWALAHVLASWDQRRAEESCGITEAERIPWRGWSLSALRKASNATKRDDPRFCEWWSENSKEAYNTGLAAASAAFDNYAKSTRGQRAGARMGHPRFTSKPKACLAKAKLPLPARTFTCGACGLALDRDHNAALTLAALAASMTGTGVAGERDTPVSKPRRTDSKTRTTRPDRQAGTGRAGGAKPRKRKEARDRRQDTQLSLWCHRHGPSG